MCGMVRVLSLHYLVRVSYGPKSSLVRIPTMSYCQTLKLSNEQTFTQKPSNKLMKGSLLPNLDSSNNLNSTNF